MRSTKGGGLSALLGLVAAIAVAAPTAALPPTEKGPAWVSVTGLAGNGAFLTGRFQPRHFGLDPRGGLVASGSLTGTLSRSGALQTSVDQQITLPVDRQPSTGSCRMINIAVGPADLGVSEVPLHMDQAIVNISMPQGPGSRLLVPLCAAGDALKQPPAQGDPILRELLNQMLSLLGQGG